MRNMLIFVLFASFLLFLAAYCESKKDPYEEGSHMDYTIICENGFVYKEKHRAILQVFNTDGTPLRCGHKIY
jgi:hypothetical protein